jgi:hypothetical protein
MRASRICCGGDLAAAHGELGAHHVRAQIRARHAEHHVGDAEIGRTLGLFDRKADRAFQIVEIDHGASAHALGALRPCARDARLAIGRSRRDGRSGRLLWTNRCPAQP